MNIYAIYTKPGRKDINPLIIKQGFSFVAGVLNLFWALYKRMWRLAFIFSLICLLPAFVKLDNNYNFLINVGVFLIFGFFAAEFEEYYANKNGYELDDLIIADSEEEAEIRYMTRSFRI